MIIFVLAVCGWNQSGLAKGVAAGPQHHHEDLGVLDLAGLGVNHIHSLTGVVNKKLLSRPVVLAHPQLQQPPPVPVKLTETAVLVALGIDRLVLLPQQL